MLSAFSAVSAEKVLCTVTSDIDNDVGKIVYEMDSDNRAIAHLYQDSFHESNRIARIELKADELKDGIVLNKRDKYVIMRMQSDNYDVERGGVLNLDTLYSGVSGERREYEMEIAMDKSGPILLQNKKQFTKMNVIAKRSKLLGIIGIEKINFGN
jgi:hypothetical protein